MFQVEKDKKGKLHFKKIYIQMCSNNWRLEVKKRRVENQLEQITKKYGTHILN